MSCLNKCKTFSSDLSENFLYDVTPSSMFNENLHLPDWNRRWVFTFPPVCPDDFNFDLLTANNSLSTFGLPPFLPLEISVEYVLADLSKMLLVTYCFLSLVAVYHTDLFRWWLTWTIRAFKRSLSKIRRWKIIHVKMIILERRIPFSCCTFPISANSTNGSSNSSRELWHKLTSINLPNKDAFKIIK